MGRGSSHHWPPPSSSNQPLGGTEDQMSKIPFEPTPFIPREPIQEERDYFAALARKATAEAAEAEHSSAVAQIMRDREETKRHRELHADPYNDRTYRFLSGIDEASVNRCITQLDAWHRQDPKCEMLVIFDSPGGSVIPGFHLFDHILALREDHKINTMTRGYAASMGGILLQAGEKRFAGPNAFLMIHEVSFGAHGKIGDVEDSTEFAKLLWKRALDIFADRCKGADPKTATKALSRRSLENKAKRKNLWIGATDALAFGLVDASA